MDGSSSTARSVPLSARPALPAAAAFILGILAHATLPHCPIAWLAATALLAIAATSKTLRQAARCACLATAIAAAGLAAAQLAAGAYPTNHISLFLAAEPRLAWVEMRIAEAPRVEQEDRGRPTPPKQLFAADVLRVKTRDGWAPASGTVRVTVEEPNEELAAGRVVRALGLLSRPAAPMNPGAFDRARFDRRRRVLALLHVRHPYHLEPMPERAASPYAAVRTAARGLLTKGFDASRSVDRALLVALVLGDREPAIREVEERFQNSGTAHLLASNGARTATLAAGVYLLCRTLCLRPRRTVLVVTAAVVLYGFALAPSPQAVRPVLLCGAIGLGLMARRSADVVQLLALAALALLVCNPLDLYAAGFQLSFVTVLGMVLFTPPVVRFLERFEDPDQRVLESFGRLGALAKLRRWAIRWTARSAAAAGVAWFVSAPLIAWHFEQVNTWTVPIGLLLSPLALASLAAGVLKVLLTAAVPPLAHAWAVGAAVPAGLLRAAVYRAARLPAADVPLARPSLWVVWAYYLLAATPLLPLTSWLRPRAAWFARVGPVGVCMLVVLSPGLFGLSRQFGSRGEVRITLLSVGAGQCAVVEPPDGRLVLIDAGSSTLPDVTRQALGPFLRNEGRGRIDEIILSHGDYDHISAAGQAVATYGAGEVVVSPHFRRHADESAPCRHLLDMLDRTGHSPRLVVAGDSLDVGGGAKIDVLWPPPASRFNSNNTALVLRLSYGGRSVLFPADIQDPAETSLMRKPELLRSDVLVAPHHGSAEKTTAAFVRAVNPRVIVSSNAFALSGKQRAFDELMGGRLLYRTGRRGAITIVLDQHGGLKVTPFLAEGTSGAGDVDAD